MPKCLVLFFLLAVLSFRGVAQSDTTYYDADGNKTEWSFASGYRVAQKENNKFVVHDYFIARNRLQMTGSFLYKDSVKDGYFVYYSKTGNKTSEGNYENDTTIGEWKYYYDSSDKIFYTEIFDRGVCQTLTSYYKGGKKKRDERYDDKRKAYGKCVDENGKEIPFTPLQIMPGPSVDLGDYLSNNLHYPDDARENNIQGKVILKFSIMPDGSVDNFTVAKSVSKECDIEAMRVLAKMPKWKPGILDDKPVRVYFTLPITFRLE